MPKLFTSGHDYHIYADNVAFENNWFPGYTYTTK